MTQEIEPIALEFAGFWRRLGAFLIDFITLAVITSILLPFRWFDFPGFWEVGNIFNSHPWLAPFWAFNDLISLLIGVAYFVAFWVWRGQTPGKMVAGIRVIRTDGSNITLGVALLRCLGYIVSAAVIFIGFIWVAFDRHKQGFHDKMADTYVVKLPQPIPAAPGARAGA